MQWLPNYDAQALILKLIVANVLPENRTGNCVPAYSLNSGTLNVCWADGYPNRRHGVPLHSVLGNPPDNYYSNRYPPIPTHYRPCHANQNCFPQIDPQGRCIPIYQLPPPLGNWQMHGWAGCPKRKRSLYLPGQHIPTRLRSGVGNVIGFPDLTTGYKLAYPTN